MSLERSLSTCFCFFALFPLTAAMADADLVDLLLVSTTSSSASSS